MISVPARAATPASLVFSLPDGGELVCLLRRSVRARRVRLTVSATGELALVAPQRQRLSAAQARDILDAHAEWIRRALERARKQAAVSRPPLELPDRVVLPALGTERRVAVRPTEGNVPVSGGSAAGVRVCDDGATLWLVGATENTPLCCAALQRWLAARARPLLTALVADMSARTGLEAAGVQIRGQRTRWGSCSCRRVLSLNYRLALLPEAQIRYLILHELCHLRHMNHSPAYRAFLAGFEPDWKARERELLSAWRALPRWSREPLPAAD